MTNRASGDTFIITLGNTPGTEMTPTNQPTNKYSNNLTGVSQQESIKGKTLESFHFCGLFIY